MYLICKAGVVLECSRWNFMKVDEAWHSTINFKLRWRRVAIQMIWSVRKQNVVTGILQSINHWISKYINDSEISTENYNKKSTYVIYWQAWTRGRWANLKLRWSLVGWRELPPFLVAIVVGRFDDNFGNNRNKKFFVTFCDFEQKNFKFLQCTPTPCWPRKLNTWPFITIMYNVSQIFLGPQSWILSQEPDYSIMITDSSFRPFSNI